MRDFLLVVGPPLAFAVVLSGLGFLLSKNMEMAARVWLGCVGARPFTQ